MEKEAEPHRREAAFPGSYAARDVQSRAQIPESGSRKGCLGSGKLSIGRGMQREAEHPFSKETEEVECVVSSVPAQMLAFSS